MSAGEGAENCNPHSCTSHRRVMRGFCSEVVDSSCLGQGAEERLC